jgi:ribosomal protein S18 acetylase RimI-like enzyme
LIRYRSFRNTDPPGLAEVWRLSAPERGFMQPMSVELFERHVLSKPYFDRHGLIVAEDEGKLIGFAHSGFGASDDFSTLSRLFGVVCLILVRPEGQRSGIGGELLKRSEEYLRSAGSKVIYAGAVHPLDPFYLGLYGGSELPGVLDSLQAAHPFLVTRGYDEVDRVAVLERDLAEFRPLVDRNQMQIRRKTSVEVQYEPSSATWWEACNFGCFDRIRFDLKHRDTGKRIARTTGWMLDPISRTWGVRAVGLVDLEVDEAFRRQGHGSFLLGEAFRRLQEQGVMVAQVQTMQRNTAALALYQKLGFHQTDGGTVYRKRSETPG